MPTGSCQVWTATIASIRGRSSTPSSIIRFAPPTTSSAGCRTIFTLPRSSDRCSCSASAAPSTIATFRSCPHACMTPGFSEAKGSPVAS